tara:strand:- start:2361 stop:2498 length:138 start_codon:yes stop_codon:yes gene_type:complete
MRCARAGFCALIGGVGGVGAGGEEGRNIERIAVNDEHGGKREETL